MGQKTGVDEYCASVTLERSRYIYNMGAQCTEDMAVMTTIVVGPSTGIQ